MKFVARTGLAVAVALGAVLVAVAPASAAIGAATGHVVVSGTRVVANPKTIKAAAYNQARSTLAHAGSQTAAKSHPIHGKADVPVGYGTSLLAAARDEFRHDDRNLPPRQKKSDMSIPHYDAIHNAARTMGLDRW